MKKKIVQLLSIALILFVGYFIYSNTRYQGVWVGTYELPNLEGSWPTSNSMILDISPFETEIYEPFVTNEFNSHSQVMLGNSIMNLKDMNVAKVKYYSNDSLSFDNEGYIMSFQKLPDSLKQSEHIDLSNRMFEIENSEFSGFIYFTKNLFFEKEKNDSINNWTSLWYKSVHKKDFQIISFHNSVRLVMHQTGNQIHSYKYYLGKPHKSVLKEISPGKEFESSVKFFNKRQKEYEDRLKAASEE